MKKKKKRIYVRETLSLHLQVNIEISRFLTRSVEGGSEFRPPPCFSPITHDVIIILS